METKEALDRISYMNELIEEGRGKLSKAWWVLFVWGLLFCLIGLWNLYTVPFHMDLAWNSGLRFVALSGLPILFSILLARPSSDLTNRLLYLNSFLVAVFLFISLQWTTLPIALGARGGSMPFDSVDLPILAVSTVLTATGVFMSRSLVKVGLLLGIIGISRALLTLPPIWLSGRSPLPLGYEFVSIGTYFLTGVTMMIYSIWLHSTGE